eukprot:767371-Prorocentrum_minimum.AAC.1
MSAARRPPEPPPGGLGPPPSAAAAKAISPRRARKASCAAARRSCSATSVARTRSACGRAVSCTSRTRSSLAATYQTQEARVYSHDGPISPASHPSTSQPPGFCASRISPPRFSARLRKRRSGVRPAPFFGRRRRFLRASRYR